MKPARWVNNFFEHALLTSTMSKDPKGRVGAVIVDDRNRIVSSGYNGLASGIEYEDILSRDRIGPHERADRLACTIHAEENALAFAWRDVKGMVMFCTRHPCARCAAMIVQRGITSLGYLVNNDTINADWARSFELAQMMFNKAEIEVVEYERGQEWPHSITVHQIIPRTRIYKT